MAESVDIPVELLEAFGNGQVVLFVGGGITRGVLPSSQELALELAKRCAYPASELLTLSRVAGYYEITGDRYSLLQFLKDRLDQPAALPPRIYELITKLCPPVIVTTCYDGLLERAFEKAGISIAKVVRNAEVAFADNQKVTIVWLWGLLDQPESLVVTEDDHRLFLGDRANLSDMLRSKLATHTWLFAGIDVEDEWFWSFYDSVSRNLDRIDRRSYIVEDGLGEYHRAWCEKHKIAILGGTPEVVLWRFDLAFGAAYAGSCALDAGRCPYCGSFAPRAPVQVTRLLRGGGCRDFLGREDRDREPHLENPCTPAGSAIWSLWCW